MLLMKHLMLLMGIPAILLAAFSCSSPENRPEKPNVILVMADDLGYECLGSYGGISYATPNLDLLAEEGMRFTHAFSQPLCTNTRTELMTGKFLHHNWVAFGILDPAERTFGHLMSGLGYSTCIVGKWQLQSYDPPGYPGAELRRGIGMHPRDAGFDEYCLWHTGHTELKGSRYADPRILENGSFVEGLEGSYGPDYFMKYLKGFISRKKDEPFFVYYPMALPHGPFVPTPETPVWSDTALRHENDVRYFGDMVSYVDRLMGQLLQSLKELDLEENTLVLFYSDNGTHQAILSEMEDRTVRGGKGLTTDAGIRVPFIARWKGQIENGAVTEELVQTVDFLPTLLDLAGGDLPEDFHTDGKSFLPVLTGEGGNGRDWIYTDFNPLPGWDKDQFEQKRFVMDREYKLYDDGRFYHWSQDLLEGAELDPGELDAAVQAIQSRFRFLLDSIPASKSE